MKQIPIILLGVLIFTLALSVFLTDMSSSGRDRLFTTRVMDDVTSRPAVLPQFYYSSVEKNWFWRDAVVSPGES